MEKARWFGFLLPGRLGHEVARDGVLLLPVNKKTASRDSSKGEPEAGKADHAEEVANTEAGC